MAKRITNTGKKSVSPPAVKNKSNYKTNHSIWVLIDNTHFAIARSRLLELAQFQLTKEQAQVLYVLRLFGGATNMTQIAAFTMRQRHSVSTLVDRMEKAGLVKKVKVPNKKGYKVTITKKGDERYQNATAKSIEMLFSSLSSEEKERFTGYLTQLLNKAREMLGLNHNPPFLDHTND
jgi:DNA-binding MarR family transcriptional regulator